jgi:hypothetical protein
MMYKIDRELVSITKENKTNTTLSTL